MFYVNNEQVKGIFLNGRNYNYLAYSFGKIIPEDRNVYQLNLNLAGKYLNKYRIEFGSIKDGYDNALVSPRIDKPDSSGIFHTPFTYYYNGNIISTKEVPVLITNGNYALSNALVYNDMNINGAINYFAENTDFQGHNVNTYLEGFGSSQSYFDSTVMSNCSNFHLRSLSRFSKGSQPTLYNCNNFSGWFNFVRGDDGTRYPGFIGFLEDCKDGVFNINCTNMHGGGSSANITNYYNFSCIRGCNNIKLNIIGSSWQVWLHDHSFTSNCYINTYNVIPGFSYMNDCNFNIYLPSNANVEKSAYYSILSNSYNCNVYFDGTNSNLYSFRNEGDWGSFLFEDLNNCNLNLSLSNSTGMDFSLGNRLNNCNIQFDNITTTTDTYGLLSYMNNCNVYGNFTYSDIMGTRLVTDSTNVNLNVNASLANMFWPIWLSSNITGNIILGNLTWMNHSNNLILYLYNGNTLEVQNINNSKFTLNNVNNVNIYGAYNTNFNLYSAAGNAVLTNLNNVEFVERGANYNIHTINKCYNSWIYANTLDGTIENAYNTRIKLKNNNPYFHTWRVNNCEITGFPTSAVYTTNCTFNASLPVVAFRGSHYLSWNNVWPHATPRGSDGWDTWYGTNAGLRSVDNFSSCYLNCNNGSLVAYGGSENFNNSNNMQTDIKKFYSGTVTANLPIYNMEIKLNVDCSTLNLGIFQAGPPHGFQNATISANTIYAKGNRAGGSTYVMLSCDTKIYCENYCNVPFYYDVRAETDVLQPVVLINNYQHSNSSACQFHGGLTRIGSLTFQGGSPADLTLGTGACLFINNALLGSTKVAQNSVLFLGRNVRFANTINVNVESGGLIVGKHNWGSHASEIWSRIDRGHLAWNIWDSGPWGWRSLFNFCIDV